MKFLFDYQYDVSKTETYTKATDTTPASRKEGETAKFAQLYSLDVQKEIFPTLKLNFGGLFDDDSTRNKLTDNDPQTPPGSDSRSTAIRPFINLQYGSKLLNAAAGYRKSELKDSSSLADTDRTFTEEYSGQINWRPVELPQVDLTFTRNLAYDNQQVDSYQLRSRYEYGNFRYNYNHSTNDAVDNIKGSSTLSNFDDGTIRFSRSYLQNKVSVSSSLRASRQLVEFSGGAEPEQPVSIDGILVVEDDFTPLLPAPDPTLPLNNVELLIDNGLRAQINLSLNFNSKTEISKIVVNLNADVSDAFREPADWSIYNWNEGSQIWLPVPIVKIETTDTRANQIKISIVTVETQYLKVVTRQKLKTDILGSDVSSSLNDPTDLRITGMTAFSALPPGTSEFKSTDFSGDMSINWKMTDKTSSGFDFLYREQRAQPLGSKNTQLNSGLRLTHTFNQTFSGSMRAQHAESRRRGENPNTSHTFSASLRANYLDTFNQTLNYGFSENNDEESRTNISNSIFLRSNLDLYQGLSLFLDNGYSWRNPAEENDSNTTFTRVGSNIIPNNWLNLTLTYGVSLERQSGKPAARSQDGDFNISIVPTSSLSLSANLKFTDDTGSDHTSTASQQYSVNWAPFRDGTLMFTMSYNQSMNADNEQVWSLSPSARWQINRQTLLSLEYGIGQQESDEEILDFENIGLSLRVFY